MIVRLFCFHHAGGGKAIFNGWNRALGPGIEVIPVEVDNRERFATMRHLVDEVEDRLQPALDGPYAFFGHSFGALLSYRLACRRTAAGFRAPRALIVSAYAPPHLPSALPAVNQLDDHYLSALLSGIGGMPPALAEWPVLQDIAVASVRTDLRLCATDEETEAVVLSCPIHAFGGSEDPLVSESDLQEWHTRTSAAFSVRTLDGGHFYLRDATPLLTVLRPLISTLAAAQRCVQNPPSPVSQTSSMTPAAEHKC